MYPVMFEEIARGRIEEMVHRAQRDRQARAVGSNGTKRAVRQALGAAFLTIGYRLLGDTQRPAGAAAGQF